VLNQAQVLIIAMWRVYCRCFTMMRMKWRDYEKQVFEEINRIYPDVNVQHDVRLPGRFSRTMRQVDIVITGIAAGSLFRTVIDTKYYNRKVHVKDIEQFIGMMEDIECSHGILITDKGFSSAAGSEP